MDITNFGKGAIRTPEDIKKNHFKLAAMAPVAINWDKQPRIRYLPVMNQRQTQACVAHATAQYGRNLEYQKFGKLEDYSVRNIYSQGYIPPDGGMYIWKGLGIPIVSGFVASSSVPVGDYSETTLRDASLNSEAIKEALPLKYAELTNNGDMDYIASVIDTYGGFVTGFNGANDMFELDGTAHVPTHTDWGHCVFVYDYGRNAHGNKALFFINSWSDGWGTAGYGNFDETFAKSRMMYDLYTYASIEDIDPTSMNNRFVQVTGQQDVWLINNGKRSLVYNALAFTLVNGDWTKIEKITQDQLNAVPDTGKVLAGIDQQ